MHEMNFLPDLVLLSTVAILIIILFQRFRIPSVIGLILTGVILGPSGFSIVDDMNVINSLSELGVILLLFTIGLEFSLTELSKLKRIVFVGGGLQVFITILLLSLTSFALAPLITSQIPIQKAFFYGMVFTVSSTPICLRILKERKELNQEHGKISLGILIFQDIAIVPLMIAISFLSPTDVTTPGKIIKELGLMILLGAGIFGGFRFFLPKMLHMISHLQAQEIWVLGGLSLCFGAAYLSHLAGLSLALGAFIAGVVIAGSDESHKVAKSIEPIRDAFTAIFFMSLGLLINIKIEFIHFYFLVAIGVILIKGSIVSIVSLLLGHSTKVSILAGMALAQVGEFSYVLASSAVQNQIITNDIFQIILTAMVITMLLAPAMIAYAPRLAIHAVPAISFIPLHKLSLYKKEKSNPKSDFESLMPEVLILGFGVIGKNVSSVLKATNIPFHVMEMNLNNVKDGKKEDIPIFYGDCTDPEALERAGFYKVKAVVIAISDESAVKESTSLMKKLRPDIYILVRTRYLLNQDRIKELGADVVVTEEFESSIQIFSLLLEKFGFDKHLILEQEDVIRQNSTVLFNPRN
ncbi:MAG: cation:proton antiporter [Leptospiraceae bacterium]|nr:cation:proton antiporter [Leptospiraceae bacterium]